MNGKLDRQLVISIIGRTWDKQIATYPSQLDGPPKGGPADIYIYMYIYIYIRLLLMETYFNLIHYNLTDFNDI